MNITSLVTGGAGFIGSHVVNHLLSKGHLVIVLDDLSGGLREQVNTAAKLHIGSVSDQELINELFEVYKFTYVYHLAAYAAEGLSHFIRKFNYENNLIGSIHLINAAVNHDVKCFVFTSSIAVYGTAQLPVTEYTIPQPEDPYGIAKYAVEMDLISANKMFGLDYVIFRPHNVYGPNQHIGDKYRNVVGIFINQILNEQPLTVFGNGEQTRAFSYIDDVAPYIADAVNNKRAYNQVFNIGSNEVSTVKELALSVCRVMGKEVSIKTLDKREEVLHSYADHTRFKTAFKPEKSTVLEEGLTRMAKWAAKQKGRTVEEFENIEIRKNLPKAWGGLRDNNER